MDWTQFMADLTGRQPHVVRMIPTPANVGLNTRLFGQPFAPDNYFAAELRTANEMGVKNTRPGQMPVKVGASMFQRKGAKPYAGWMTPSEATAAKQANPLLQLLEP